MITSVELKSKLHLKKGFVDFSDIEFPSPQIDNQKVITIKRKLLSKFRHCDGGKRSEELDPASTSYTKINPSIPKTDSSIKIITIGKDI